MKEDNDEIPVNIDLKFDRKKLYDQDEEIEPKESWWLKFKRLVFMMWDGAAAFNHNEVKLKRIQGQKPKCSDRCRTKDTIYTLLLFFIIYSFVIHDEL